MAKAKDKHTPAAEPLTPEEKARLFDAAFANATAKLDLPPATVVELRKRAADAAAKSAKLNKARTQLKQPAIATPQTPKTKKTRRAPQVERAMRAILELYPDGRPPSGVSIETVTGEVAGYLEREPKVRGVGEPSPDSVNRALIKLQNRKRT